MKLIRHLAGGLFLYVALAVSAVADNLIQFSNHGAVRWQCVEVVDGKDIPLTDHVVKEVALACSSSNQLLYPDRHFDAVSRERIHTTFTPQARADILLGIGAEAQEEVPIEAPSQTTGMAIETIGDTSISTITWDDDANVDFWTFILGLASGDGEAVQTLSVEEVETNSKASVTGLDEAQWYYIRACPFNAAGGGGPSCSDRLFFETTGTGAPPDPDVFPVFQIYENFMDLWGAAAIPETDSRYWSKPDYPTTGTVYTSCANLQTALDANPAPGTVLRLDDESGPYNNCTITVPAAADGVVVAAETKSGVRFTGSSTITINATDVDVFGFEWSDTTTANSMVIANASDPRICYITVDNVSASAGRPNAVIFNDAPRFRLCYSTFNERDYDGQWFNVVETTQPYPSHGMVDHNYFGNHKGDGGASEVFQVGQAQPFVDYFLTFHSNVVENHNNDGAGNRVNSNESEIVSLKSSKNLVIHNYFNCSFINPSFRAATDSVLYGNFVNGCGSDWAAGLWSSSSTAHIIANYFWDGNASGVDVRAAIKINKGIEEADYTSGDYLAAHDNHIAFNTIYNWGDPIEFGNQPPGAVLPRDGTLHNNAVERNGAGSSVSTDNRGTGWASAGNVFESPKGTALGGITEAVPGFTLTNGLRIPTAAGNLDGTGSTAHTALATHYIDGTPIPGASPDVGAFPVGADVTVSPVTEIVNGAGVDGL